MFSKMSASKLRVMVVYGSSRDGRMCDRVAKFVTGFLEKHGHQVDEVDPNVLNLPLLKQPVQFMKDPATEAPKTLLDLNERVKAADGYIVLTPEYNRNIPPALTNIIDYCPPASYAYKISAIVSYSMGPLGGEAAGIQARTLMVEMGALPIPRMVSIPLVQDVIKPDGSTDNERVIGSMKGMVELFDWWALAAKSKREKQ